MTDEDMKKAIKAILFELREINIKLQKIDDLLFLITEKNKLL